MITVLLEGLDHPECVAWGRDGKLYAGGEAGQIYRIDSQTKEVEEFSTTAGLVLGIALDAESNVYACDAKRSEFLKISHDGTVSILSNGTTERPMKTPNYPVFDRYGNLYVSDSGTWPGGGGCIYKIDKDANTSIWSNSTPQFTNGLGISPDGRWLYVVESTLPGITRIEILKDGSAGRTEIVVLLPGTVPDGMAFDVEGNLYIGCYRPDRIYKFTTEHQLLIFADDYQGTLLAAPTNLAFGGETLNTLFIASLARWHIGIVTTIVAGAPLNYPPPIVRRGMA
jgi:gluconolactonase